MKIFISAPISSVSEESILFKDEITALKRHLLRNDLIKSVFYAGENIKHKNDFDSPVEAFKEDIGELLSSDIYLLIYPEKLATSALFEAGVAYSKGMTMVFYCYESTTLPFLFYGIEAAHIAVYHAFDDIVADFDDFLSEFRHDQIG